jgi:hypothetical protein
MGHRIFWWTEANVSCNHSAVATCEHVDSASSPTCLQLIDGDGNPGKPGKHSPDIPEPPTLEGPRVVAASPEAPRSTKSRSELSTSSPS